MGIAQSYLIREEVIKAIRLFFENRNFHEVITPILNTAVPIEQNIFPFQTEWNTTHGIHQLVLTTSPERGLKKMLAKGIGNCYAIGKSFRNLEGNGPQHNPEFLMLEWYREEATYEVIMQDIKELILEIEKRVANFADKTGLLKNEWTELSLEQLFAEHAGLHFLDILTDEQLYSAAQKKGYSVTNASWSQIFDQIFLNEVVPHLPKGQLFLKDFPARLSPLCALHKNKKYLAERFEFFIDGTEISNGNNENVDADSVESVFLQEQNDRQRKGFSVPPIDQEFLEALRIMKRSGKQFAGVGFGVDRLAMIMSGTQHIKDIDPFWIAA